MLTCEPNQVFVRFTKKTMDSYYYEESFEVYSGSQLLMTSPSFAKGELRDVEFCLPESTNRQYSIHLLDSGRDSWQSGSWVKIAGIYGNIVFRNFMTQPNEEIYPFSLYYAVMKEQQWKLTSYSSTIPSEWTSFGFDDSAWQDATLGSFTSQISGTQYFRKTFTSLANMAAYELQMNYRYGIVAYVNGVEVFRDHMPAGVPTPTTLSEGSFPSSSYYGIIRPSTETLPSSANILAVELHFPVIGTSFIDFDAFMAVLAPSIPDDPCFIYGDEVDVSSNVGSNVNSIFDFAKINYYTVPVGRFPGQVTYAFTGSRPYVNGIRIWPYTGYASSPGSFVWEGHNDVTSSEWNEIISASSITYTSSTYKTFFSYLSSDLYKAYRFQILSGAATQYARAYEVQPLVCSLSAPTGIEFESASYSFYVEYEDIVIRPKVVEFTNCSVTPSLPAGLSLNPATCIISGKGEAASSGTYEVTAVIHDTAYHGSFSLHVVECEGTLVSVVRSYRSDAYKESFTIQDAATQQVVLSVEENSGQINHQEWSALVCLTGSQYTVTVDGSTMNWESTSHLYVRAVLTGDEYETVLRAHYDAYQGLPTARSFNAQWSVTPRDQWFYKMNEVPANWFGAETAGWSTGSMGGFTGATTPIQLYKKTFTVASLTDVSGLAISLRYLYGCVIYLNGHEAFRNGVEGELSASSIGLNAYTDLMYRQISLPARTLSSDNTAVDFLVEGANTIAIAIVAQTASQTNSVFNCAVRVMRATETSRLFDYSVTYSYIQGNPSLVADQHYEYSMYYSSCNTNHWTVAFKYDRREWISSVTLYLHYQQGEQQPTQFVLKARNGNTEEWTTLKTVTDMKWSLVGQHKKIWTGNSKPYNQYRFENFATGSTSACYWKLGTLDLSADAMTVSVPPLSYPSPLVISKDIEMGEAYPNSDYYFDFTVSPALPEGLSIDPNNGMISGTAHTVVTEASYTVQAKKATGGVATAVIELSVEICTGDKGLITLVVRTDSYPDQMGYKLYAGRGTAGAVEASVEKFSVKNALNYGDFCMPHGIYTAELLSAQQRGWGSPGGWYLTVDVGEMIFETGQVPSGVASVSTSFSSLIPFQIEYDDWKLWNSMEDVSEDWKSASFDDSAWETKKAAEFGNHVGTTAYVRREVVIPSLEDYHVLNIRMKYAGGVAAYFNGRLVARFNLEETFDAATEAIAVHDASLFSKFHIVLPTVGAVAGKNVIAFEIHRAAGESAIVFDATGVFGVNDCSITVDSFSSVESSKVTTTTTEGLFDLKPTSYGYLANAVHSFAKWTVENLEGSKFNSFAMQTILDRTGYGFSVYGRFHENEEYMNTLAVGGQETKNRGRCAWAMPVGIAGFRDFMFEVDVAASGLVTMYSFVMQYCKPSGTGYCPAVGDYPAVGEGEVSPSTCPEGFRGYSYRNCTGGVLGDVQLDKCEYKEPANLRYVPTNFVFVQDVASSTGVPTFTNLITEFYIQEETPLPPEFSLNPLTGEITGKPLATLDATTVYVRGKNPTGETFTEITIAVRKGYCPPETVFDRTPVGEEAVFECSRQGNFVGTQRRMCLLGKKDGEWQAIKGNCVPVSVVVVVVIVVILIILVVVLLIVRSSRRVKAVGGVKGKSPKETKTNKAVKV